MPHRLRPFILPSTAALLLGASLAAPAIGQAVAPPPPLPGASPVFSDPVLPDAVVLRAAASAAWQENGPQGPTRCLLLEGPGLSVRAGAHAFSATRAFVRIRSENTDAGPVRHLALYLENARSTGEATIGAEAPHLLVTLSTSGKVTVVAALMSPLAGPPAGTQTKAFLADARRRLDAPTPAVETPTPAAGAAPLISPKALGDRDKRRQELADSRRLNAGKTAGDRPARPPADTENPMDTLPHLPAITPRGKKNGSPGAVHFSCDRNVYQQGDAKQGTDDAVMLMGHVQLAWESSGHQVEIQAENAVVFLDRSANGQMDDSSKVRGIYLEDNAIISDGDYTVRAPRMYFDVPNNRATLLDAVLYALDTKAGIPLYLRAKLLRLNAEDSLEARHAVLSNSGFAEPSFAIGVQRLTISQTPAEPGNPDSRARGYLNLHNATPMIDGMPVLWLPRMAVPAYEAPLRSFSSSYSGNEGPVMRSKWDVYGILDRPAPHGEDLSADLDFRGNHGPALGGEYGYEHDNAFGRLRAYSLPQDDGTDRIPGRNNIPHHGDSRDFLRFEHRHILSSESGSANGTELTVQAAHESDPSVRETFFPDYAERPPETGASLKHQYEDWAVTATASMQANDFTSSMAQLEAKGYQTERLEGEFRRIGTELFDGRGNWFSENRAGRVRAAVGRDAPSTRGITAAASLADFGQADTVPFRATAAARGIPTAWVNRADSRQEIAIPLQSGPVDVTPFGVLRYTTWSHPIELPGGAEDSQRLYGGAGVRLATELVGDATPFKSQWLDVDGLRHIVRPELDAGYYASSMNSGTLPMFDPDVEGLGEGLITRFGLVNTWQTHRGENDNRHTIDWLRFKQDVVLRNGESDPARAVPRYVDWRPEYASGGSHTFSELLWQTTDALAINGEATYTFDSGRVEQWSSGASYNHTDRLTSRLNYRETKIYDEQLVSYGIGYQLTQKYYLNVAQSFDLGPEKSGQLNATLDRRMPGGTLQMFGTYDELNGSYSIGLSFSPQGLGSGHIGHSLYRREPR